MDSPRQQQGPGLIESAWRYRYWIVGMTVLFGVLGYGFSLLQSEVYEAEARIVLGDPRATGMLVDTARGVVEPERRLVRETERITSRPVLDSAADRLEGPLAELTATDLSEAVSAEADVELEAIELTARMGTAEEAAEAANAVAEAYQDVVADDNQAQTQAAIEELNEARQEASARLEELQEQLEEDPEDGALQAEVEVAREQLTSISNRAQELAVDAALFGSGVDVYEPAQVPEAPTQPRPLRTSAAAAVLAGLATGAIAWWRAEYTQVVESAGDVAEVLGAPSLGEIPVFRLQPGQGGDRPLLPSLDSQSVEAFHFLVASLQFALDDVGGKTVAVTSVGPGDGKTVTAMNLAFAAALDGRGVLLIDADERLRGLTTRLRLDGKRGLTDLVQGRMLLQDGCYSVGVPDAPTRLLAMPAGSRIGEVAGFFRRPEFRRTMQALKQEADLLLVDTPPLLAVSDVLQIASQAQGVLVVVDRRTSRSRLRQAKERLDLVGTPILGFVLNRSKARESSYGYQQYYRRTARSPVEQWGAS